LVAALAAVARPAAQGPGFGGQADVALVERFDTNKDGRLNATERKAARASVASQGGGFFGGRRGRGGPPGFGGRGGATPSEGRRISPADVRSAGKAPLYDPATLRTVFLQFEDPDWEAELADFHNSDVEVPAVAIVDGQTYRDVGVHFRGMSSFMVAGPGQKRSLNLSFDFVDKDQRLLGYRTLNLLNANGDPTFLRPVVYADIANQYLPAPKANFMRVVINGEYWGVYVNSQQFNSDFTNERFGSTKGRRWKVPGSPGARGAGLSYLGEDAALYKRSYEIKTKDDEASWAELIRLTRVLNQTPVESLEAALAPMLDVDGALRFLAVDVALVNSDGYWTRASDYSLYQDEKGRFHVVPHDMNEGLAEEGGGRGRGRGGFAPAPPGGGFGFGGPGGPGGFGPGRGGVDLDPLVAIDHADKPLRSKLLAVPALRARYLQYVREIATTSLDWNRLGPSVARYRALIAEDVKADTRKLFTSEAFEAGVADLQNFVERRRAYLLAAR
jgi:hypothetical protein